MKAHSFNCENTDHLRQAVLLCKKEGFEPNLAIVFGSKSHSLKEIQTICSDFDINLLGCTTAGEIVDGVLYEKSISMLLLSLPPDSFKVLLEENEREGIYQTAFNLGRKAMGCYERPSLIVTSGGLTTDADLLIKGIRDGAGKDLDMYGGLAGDDLEMISTQVFTNDSITDNGIALLIIDSDKIAVQGLATSGWEAVGGVNTITKSEGNVLYTINNERAYDVFTRYFGLSDDQTKNDQFITIQTNYPLQIMKSEEHAILRSPMIVDEKEGTLTLTGGVKEGDQFRFSNSPGFEVIEQTIAEFNDLQSKVPDADALILFSCKGRHGAFGPMLEDEIVGVYDQWKKPMIGFLSYGEFGDAGTGKCEFHNETCSLVILKEK